MKKYYLTNSQEVTIGDRISSKAQGLTITITADNLPYLVANKVIIEKEEKVASPKVPELEFHTVIESIGAKQNWTVERTAGFLNKVHRMHKGAAIAIILREIALLLDHRYPDNIRTCEQVYIISNPNGKILLVNTKVIKSFETFAAFRTKKDAELAFALVKPLVEDTYDREFKSAK